MTLIQTPAINGSIFTASRPNGGYSVRTMDRYGEAIAYLTADQAADLLEALVLLGVKVTEKAEKALDLQLERL